MRVHAYNRDFLILRQAGRTHFEKPFLYLVFGGERALLVDTGAPGLDLSAAVWPLITAWADQSASAVPHLLVAHTHGHSDHVACDDQFRGDPRATVIASDPDAVCRAFHLDDWPRGIGFVDLGGRLLDVIPVPGHDPASVAFYDRRTGVLLPGDVLYPGRLYVRDAGAFRDSIDRLVAFTSERPIAHILGAHIENTRTPFVDYPEGTAFQPDEHPLELGRAHLLELRDALRAMAPGIERRVLRDFTIVPVRT
jgi:glyoxylase-like metal-dependent hydrolase (beta-lactamase superfamily II)